VVENLGEGVAIINPDESIIFANPSAERIFGVPPGALVGENLSTFTSPEQYHEIESQTHHRKNSGINTYQFDVIQKNGGVRNIIFTATPHSVNGDYGGALGIFRDITEIRTAEKALQEREERYRTIFETAGVSIWEEDFSQVKPIIESLKHSGVRDFREYIDQHPELLDDIAKKISVVDVNEATLSMFGAKSKDELLGSLDRIFVPETRQILRDELIALAEGRTFFEGETINQTLHGDRLNVLLTMTFPSDQEELEKVLISLMDITDRKFAEQEIATQKSRFQQLFENAPIAIVVLDEQDRIEGINKAFESIFQYRSDEVLGCLINDIIVPDELFKEATSLTLATMEGASVQKETIRKRKDSSLVPVQVFGVPILLGDHTEGVYGMYVDISDRKQKEQKLEFLSSHDALTGLYNRSYFEIEMDRLERDKIYPTSLIVADVDGLKSINDRLGHAAGDRLLKTSAKLLRKAFRSNDVVARIGGDEFATLLPGADGTTAALALDRVREILEGYNQENPDSTISISFGVATGHRNTPFLQVFKDADRLMYEEKTNKRLAAN
jgi:diguanylate cyclase (GGDEF)-like protein/PAS domain S-box-containing protein